MMNIAIIDDQIRMGEHVKKLCETYFEAREEHAVYHVWTSGEQLLSYCKDRNNDEIDVVFLDIEMPGMSGIQIKEYATDESMVHRIIFFTSHQALMREAFGTKVIAFLDKPVQQKDVDHWLQYVQNQMNKNVLLPIEEAGIYLDQLEYIEGEKNYSKLHLRDGSEQWCWENMKYLENVLSDLPIIRVHKSYMVNMMYVQKISDCVHILDKEFVLPVGRRYKAEAKDAFKEYIMKEFEERMK